MAESTRPAALLRQLQGQARKRFGQHFLTSAGTVQKIVARAEAKARKDWAVADAIRDELTTMGVMIKDGPEGTTWSRIVE